MVVIMYLGKRKMPASGSSALKRWYKLLGKLRIKIAER